MKMMKVILKMLNIFFVKTEIRCLSNIAEKVKVQKGSTQLCINKIHPVQKSSKSQDLYQISAIILQTTLS